MKAKKFQKKLTLNRETISNIDNGRMDLIKGGATVNGCTLPFTLCPYTNCGDSLVVVCYC